MGDREGDRPAGLTMTSSTAPKGTYLQKGFKRLVVSVCVRACVRACERASVRVCVRGGGGVWWWCL